MTLGHRDNPTFYKNKRTDFLLFSGSFKFRSSLQSFRFCLLYHLVICFSSLSRCAWWSLTCPLLSDDFLCRCFLRYTKLIVLLGEYSDGTFSSCENLMQLLCWAEWYVLIWSFHHTYPLFKYVKACHLTEVSDAVFICCVSLISCLSLNCSDDELLCHVILSTSLFISLRF